MVIDQDQVCRAVRALVDAAPVAPPPPAAVRARAEAGAGHWRERRWLVPALAAGSVFALIATVVVWWT